MRNGLTTILCLSLLFVPIAQHQDDNFLDLTKNRPPQKKRTHLVGKGGGVGVGNGLHMQKTVPLKLTLLSLDKRSYQLGDHWIYEVILENITRDTLVIPWSPDYDRVKPDEEKDPPGYLHAFLSLVINDEVSGQQFMPGEVIYGSELVPGSLKRLHPGQKVRIRASGQIYFGQADVYKRVLAKLPDRFDVRANFTLWDRPINPCYEPAVSTNSITIELKRRR